MPSAYELRPLRKTDAPALAAFYKSCGNDGLAASGNRRGDAESFVAKHSGIVAVSPDDEILGVGAWMALDADRADVTLLISDEWQGRGVGRALAAAMFEAVRRLGFKTVSGGMRHDNAGAKKLISAYAPKWRQAKDLDHFTVTLSDR